MIEAREGAPDYRPQVGNAAGNAPVVLVCEHASNAIPARFGGLGLAPGDEWSHAASDPGALGVARAMASVLDAPLVAATVSRLGHDCNRPAGAREAMPEKTEEIAIPGNADLFASDRDARARLVHAPFHAALSATIAARPVPPALVTVHSVTPVWHGLVLRRSQAPGLEGSRCPAP